MLEAKYIYPPYSVPLKWREANFRFDNAKMNLLWLVFPAIDRVHDKRWEGNAISASINEHLDFATREKLNTLQPFDFVNWFEQQGTEDWLMTESWPENYLQIMHNRARTYNVARLCGLSKNSNVVAVDFSFGRVLK